MSDALFSQADAVRTTLQGIFTRAQANNQMSESLYAITAAHLVTGGKHAEALEVAAKVSVRGIYVLLMCPFCRPHPLSPSLWMRG